MITDFIIIGSGLAGLTSALILKDFGRVLIVTKGKLDDCATNLAQGGIAAAVTNEDSFRKHIKDTLIAGCFHNNKEAVEYTVKHAPEAILWLVKQGVRFDRKDGQFAPTREAAHSCRRVLHATDFTGKEVERALNKRIRESKNIVIWEDCFVVDLFVKNNVCYGVKLIGSSATKSSIPNFSNTPPKSRRNSTGPISSALEKQSLIGRGRSSKLISSDLYCKAVILATGGIGQLYQWTTNPTVATGDGLAMAYRAGAKLRDMEFIQFHPTALKDHSSPLFLLSEALRGEGAHLLKCKVQSAKCKAEKGERFMGDYDKRMELAPRDIVARAIYEEQKRGYDVFLDIRHKGEKFLKMRFPNIYKELKKRGFDLVNDLIPVTPAAHYSCGGIETDLYGRTNIKSLYAFGEVACTGVHGANRLASNSLLEAVVFPLRFLKESQNLLRSVCFFAPLPSSLHDLCLRHESRGAQEPVGVLKKHILPANSYYLLEIRDNLQKMMWEKVGIVRTRKGLKEALQELVLWEKELIKNKGLNKEHLELRNMIQLAIMVVEACINRPKSLGAHFMV